MQNDCAVIYSDLLGHYLRSLAELENLLAKSGQKGVAALLKVHLLGLDELKGLIEASLEDNHQQLKTKECEHAGIKQT